MKKKVKVSIVILIIFIISAIIFNKCCNNDKYELKSIKSEKQLLQIYNQSESDSTLKDIFLNGITMPFSLLLDNWTDNTYTQSAGESISSSDTNTGSTMSDYTTSSNQKDTYSKDYSTTNIQVENVDEADITKTDGDYIYSISENDVIITNVKDPNKIEIASTIKSIDGSIPEDLIIYKDELIVISQIENSNSTYYYSRNNTSVRIYDVTQKNNPILLKNYELYQPYYTSRCIGNKLYVIACGYLRKEDDKIATYYKEDNQTKEISLNNIKYLKDVNTGDLTLISVVDLDNIKSDIKLSSYLIDISNAYVSENAIYLLNQEYKYYNYAPPLKSIFGLKGILGAFLYDDDDNDDYGYYTEIYKFDILKDGYIKYNTRTKIKGKTINQYSLDEYNGHLRVALYDNDGARVGIFNEKLQQIGMSKNVAKGETMYSSRFINNKVYLVTYKTMDPLFVIDLSNDENPEVLGELKIPGYSTYLHPYDENHLIGIGMETEEVINRNSSGKVTSTTSKIIGMKMALFDVTDVNNPIQISDTIIGDKRTTSAILTNPKALLFSKEKNLIAIPVNNYNEDFEITSSNDTYSSIINSYKRYEKEYTAEGYFVYNIDIESGFNLKGIITHEKQKKYSYGYNSKLLRGLYIDNNLYTVSETAIKVNDLDTLELLSELKIE